MKVVHFECGLGNQMVCYANYLLVKKYNPDEKVFMEGLIYNVNNSVGISQWNGYELEKIFGISIPDVTDLIENKDKLQNEFNLRHNYNEGTKNSESSLYAFRKCGVLLETDEQLYTAHKKKTIKDIIIDYVTSSSENIISFNFKKIIYRCLKYYIISKKVSIKSKYFRDKRDYFYPLSFDVMKDYNLVLDIKEELIKDFTFPPLKDEKNIEIKEIIDSSNSVSIHARRSDFLQYNSDCYKYGYFRKAVKYIKKKVKNPVFFIFSEDAEWCKSNLGTLGLDDNSDSIYFIDWNSNDESFRDMQLMSYCKHNIITKSSFGWWAGFLNRNPNKIVCSQYSEYYSVKYF